MLRRAVGEFGARVPTRHYTTGRMTTYNPMAKLPSQGVCRDRPPERHRSVRGATRSPLNNIETLQGRVVTNKQTTLIGFRDDMKYTHMGYTYFHLNPCQIC